MNSLNSTPNSELTHPTVHWKFLPWSLVVNVVIVQLISHVRLFGISWTTACQAPLSSTVSWSLLKFMSIELVMLSSHFILCHPLLFWPLIFPSIRIFSNESSLHIRWPKYWSFSFSISPSSEYSRLILLGLTGLSSLQPKGLSRAFSSTTIQRHQFFSIQPYLWSNSPTTHYNWKNHSFDYTDLCQQSDVSAF